MQTATVVMALSLIQLRHDGQPAVATLYLWRSVRAGSRTGPPHARHAAPTTRIASLRSNGFASTSYAPRFRASAHRGSSARRDVTTREGGSGRMVTYSNTSLHEPGIKSPSQTTTSH